MVFEAVVVELLNKFLKQYVENLDTSQLKIGIWGGDVVLKDLKIKTTIFDDLNLPVRVKWGKLEKLSLRIPWKNLYSAPVIVEIQGLLMIIAPNIEFNYDPVKEEKWAQDKKQAKLKAIEDAKKQELEKCSAKNDGFLEKLMTQIIKNLQILITNIHIRYEDKTTITGSSFSVGITLSTLSAETTTSDSIVGLPKLVHKNDNFICKEIDLEGLSIYWNCSSVLFSDLSDDEVKKALIQSIPKSTYKPVDFMYLFGPLSASAFLRLNPKPEADGSDFKIPKVFANIYLKEIDLAITNNQFSDAMSFLQDYRRFVAASKYRKYRPVGIPIFGHAKEWWHFAYTAVLQDIIRRKTEWSWSNIKEHRQICRKYAELFKVKLSSKKMLAEDAAKLSELEKKLNIFNLILIREQVYVQVERKDKENTSSGWFSGWFGYGTESKADANEDELVKKIQSVMTIQEKQKLYKAIGYEETAPPTKYPVRFVELQFWFHLDEIKATIYDCHTNDLVPVMTISVRSVKMELEKRPSDFAMKFVLVIGNFEVTGKQENNGTYPELVTSNCDERESLIELLYETKPLNANCDQRIFVNARPLRIIFHAETLKLVREVFKTQTSEEVEKIVAATAASLPTFQRITSLGLQYAIEKQSVLEVKVNIQSSYLIIPYGGTYHPEKDMLVLLLGRLNVETEENEKKNISVKKLFLEGTTNEDIFSTVLSASYTKFKCRLSGVQILFQMSGEDWVSASEFRGSPLQFLEPTNLVVVIKKSLVTDDARIPKIMIEGVMPSLAFNFSEERFLSFMALVSSIQMHTEKPISKKETFSSAWSIQSFGVQLENKLVQKQKDISLMRSTEYTQGIDLVGHFEMNELSVTVTKSKQTQNPKKSQELKAGAAEKKFLYLSVVRLEMELTNKTFEIIYLFKLGGIEFKQYHNKDWLPFISTKNQKNNYLFVVEYIYLDTKIPDFYTARDAIVSRLTLSITPLSVLLEKAAILAQLEFVTNVKRRVELVRESFQSGHMADAGKGKDTIYEELTENIQVDKKVIAKGKRFRKKTPHKEVIDLFLQASLEEIDVVVEYKNQGLAEFGLKGASVEISTRKSYATVDVNIRNIQLLDLNPQTRHLKILTSLEDQTLSSRLTFYDKEYFGSENSLDMSVEAEVGGIQCTFVTVFIARALEFLSAFQSQMQTLKQGAAIAAQKAKENMVKAFQNAAQVCLKLKITAPLLLFPRSSLSMETLAVDLGVLTIRNSIAELDSPLEGELTTRPLMDIVKVHLKNLKISRCTYNEISTAMEKEKVFLVPVTFDLTLKRNLSKNWCKVIPELEILAQLASVQVTLSHQDLCAIVNTLQENINEGENVAKEDIQSDRIHAAVAESKASQPLQKQKEKHVVTRAEALVEEEKVTTDSSNQYTLIKFNFFMHSFIFDALTETSEKNDVGLGKFVLETISVKGRLFSDSSLSSSIMLVRCLIDDIRPGREEKLTRLLERSEDSGPVDSKAEPNHANSMIEIMFQKNLQDCFVDLRVYKFTLILSMDFLQQLGEFFKMEDIAGSENLKKPVKTIEKQIENEKRKEVQTFTLNIRLEKPNIIVVENMDSINADALIFHTEMVLKYRLASTKQIVSGTLRDIELYSCCFNPLKRPQTMNKVIKPFTVSVAGSTPEGSGLHVDICLTEISISVNPGTVNLISKCCKAFVKDSSSVERSPLEEKYSDLYGEKPFTDNDHWFLKAEVGEDALSNFKKYSSEGVVESHDSNQICLMAIPSINILIEGMPKSHAQPLLLLEMGFQMRCYNWSSSLKILSSLTLEMKYYNSKFFNWEPLIEPNENFQEETQKQSYLPWELEVMVTHDVEGELENLRPPKSQITLCCSEILQLTVTKTCMEVLKATAEIYSSAVTKHVVKKLADLPPYIVKNETGEPVELLLGESNLKLQNSALELYHIVRLNSNSEVELENAQLFSCNPHESPSLSLLSKEIQLYMAFPEITDRKIVLPLGVPSKRYYPLPSKDPNSPDVKGVVADVSIVDISTTIVLRTAFSVTNYFNEPINLHVLSESGAVAEFVGAVEGNSSFNLPFEAVYNSHKMLFFSVSGYYLSDKPFDLDILQKEFNTSQLLQCNNKIPESHDPFFIQAVGEGEEIYLTITNRKSKRSTIFNIHLQPTVKIFNSLPTPLVICFQGSVKERYLQPGNNLQITNAEPGTSTVTLRIENYLEKEWSCKEKILESPSEFLVWKFVSYNGLDSETLNLGVHVTYKKKTAVYTIYCPYLMINKTEHLLSYKFAESATVFYHPGDFQEPIMFSPTSKKFFSKKMATVQVEQSEWSDEFPLDVAGSGGTVECSLPDSDVKCKISVTISLTYNSLSKVVVFAPFYVFFNAMEYSVECQECNLPKSSWLEIPANSCVPFWPRSRRKEVRLRPRDSDATTPAFAYHSTDVCLLRLSHKYGGINATIKATQSGNYITLGSYEPGQAPALVINHRSRPIRFRELGTELEITLQPYHEVLHAWFRPTGKRKLVVGESNDETIISLDEDDESIIPGETQGAARYVTFLDGGQRVLLFTDDLGLSRSISSIKLGSSGVEVVFKIQGIGLSLVNDLNRVEILYLAFVSSGVTWEKRKLGKTNFTQMNQEEVAMMEDAYLSFQEDLYKDPNANPVVQVDKKHTVNFQSMELIEPTHRELRRTFKPGFWCAYRQLEDQVMLHTKINRIQVDSQLLDCVFPVVLAPIPPPNSLSALDFKPFFELSLVKVADGKGMEQYKYFKTLIQEFHVKVDIGFIQQVYQFLVPDEMSHDQEKVLLRKDLEQMEKPLKAHIEVVSSNEQKYFYDLLHFSPLKIHFSFSLAGKLQGSMYSLPPSINVMIQSVGITLTDVHDVIFRLSYMERRGTFLTNRELINEVVSHYYGQIIKQAYVLVLGLDVIGNPYGLIVGIGEGVEAFFYEPFQGMIRGPSEFGKGVARGWKSFFGHTVGSAAGTLGKLTETLGKGLAVLSLDKEYQMQRMVNQSQRDDIQTSMARGGRDLFMGVVDGVTGIVRKPIKGAKEEGVGGFFKGMGKGMMGLVTRPASGIVDFASTSFNAVKRCTVLSAESKRLRPPRFFRDDNLIVPYNFKEAQGHSLLFTICKQKYCRTDKYEYHVFLKEKEVCVLTNKRIILAEFSEIFGTWQEYMAITWKSMPSAPRCHTKGVALTMPTKNVENKPDVKVLLMEPEPLKKEVCRRMTELYHLEKSENDEILGILPFY